MLNVGYIILNHMLTTPSLAKRSFPYASIITRIVQYFQVLITEPTFLNSRELGDETIANLGFYWRDNRWYKDQRNKKVTEIAPIDHHFFNNVLSPHLLPDLSAPHRSHPQPSKGPSHSTPADFEDPMQQLLTKLDSLSQQQGKLQSQLEAFNFSLFPSKSVSLSSSNAYLSNNIAFLLNSSSFLMASSNFLPLLDFHHHPLHHILHLLRTLFYFQSCVTLHYISTCIFV